MSLSILGLFPIEYLGVRLWKTRSLEDESGGAGKQS